MEESDIDWLAIIFGYVGIALMMLSQNIAFLGIIGIGAGIHLSKVLRERPDK